MKIKIITITTIILAAFIFRLSIIKDKIDNYEFVYEEVRPIVHKVYYYDNGKFVSVDITFNNEVDFIDVFDLLTNKSNSIIENYDTKLITSTKVINYFVEEDTIYLNLTEDFLRYKVENSFEIFNQIQFSFSNLGYNNLILSVEGSVVEKIGYINISSGITLSNI